MPDALEALLASSEDCIKLLDRQGCIVALNPGGVRLMQADDPGQLVGQNWIGFWHGQDRDDAQAAFDRALAGEVGRSAGMAPTLKGVFKHWDALLSPMPNAGGEIDRILVITRDMTALEDANQTIGLEQRRNAALIRAMSQIVWRSKDGLKVEGHEDWLRYCGLEDLAATPFQWLSAVHIDDLPGVHAQLRQGLAAQEAYEITYRLRHRSGAWRWVEDRAVPIRDDRGEIVEWVGLIIDVHERVEKQSALRASEERLFLAIEASRLGIWDRDLDGGNLTWSPEIFRMLGMPADTAPSDALLFSRIPSEDHDLVRRFVTELRSGSCETLTARFRVVHAETGELRWIATSGRNVCDEAGRQIRRIGTWQDVTEATLAQRELWRAANHDALTGLANRNLFGDLLDAAIRAATDDGTPFAVLLLDLDDFKSINDTLGHGIGDIVLKTTAERLRRSCAPGATVARLGGDEFAILLERIDGEAVAVAQAERLVATLSQPIAHADGIVHCTASAGVVACLDGSSLPQDALRNADLALFEAKKAGLGKPALFSAGMASVLLARATGLRRIEEALARDAVVPFYQPKIHIATGRIEGFEALLRWHDGQGWCAPGPIAHAFDHPVLATRLGGRILDGVLADLSRWRAGGLDVGRIAINVSSVEFSTNDIAEHLLGRLAEAGLAPTDLDLEVTESVVLGAQAATVGPALRRLHDEGLVIALDDFGTGFASLTHLRQHPFDWLKIERSFVCDMEADADAAAIVSAVIGLAHAMGRRVVAEGVETEAQLAALRRHGCDVAQGYLIAKPMPASRVPHFVQTWAGFAPRPEELPIAS